MRFSFEYSPPTHEPCGLCGDTHHDESEHYAPFVPPPILWELLS